ncbi:MAG: hypothetical protein ACT4TC_02935 [Myxococcaceae bacterium]
MEFVGHFAFSGHFAHFEPDESDLGGDEHGCTAGRHQCGCCQSQTILLPDARTFVAVNVLGQVLVMGSDVAPLTGHLAPPFRPPISFA